MGVQTTSPSFGAEDPRLMKPRFQRVVDRAHPLWKAHAGVDETAWTTLTPIIREMEANCVKVREYAKNVTKTRLAWILPEHYGRK